MSEFVRLCSRSELPPEGQAAEIPLNGRVICVANVKGEICAMDNVCLHRGGPLGQGVIEGGKLVCPWHGWIFDPKTGAAAHDSNARVPVYATKIVGDDVLIEV
ncbi:MAG TPA: Rieske (2Fe-2S) protein [Terriglobales bacterium]|nr:Rieske (2Fe-2S) protein [Terriglobales bacterium]